MCNTGVNDAIHRSLQSAGIHVVREPPGLGGQLNLRPDGVSLLPWNTGKPMIWDYTCPVSQASSHIFISSATAGAPAVAGRHKATKYAVFAQRYDVIPVAIATLRYGSDASAFIDTLGTRITQATGEPRSATFLRQSISMAIQRGNAAAILGTQRHLMSLQREI